MAEFDDYDLVTPDVPSDPIDQITPGYDLHQGLSFVDQMKASITPVTAHASGGSSGPRPTSGLIFPRGMG